MRKRPCKTRADAADFSRQLYSQGNGVEKDFATAKKVRKSGRTGFRPCTDTGRSHVCQGRRYPTQHDTGGTLAQPRGDQGETDAQTFLGILYLDGTELHQNLDRAIYRFRQAAEKGDANAQAALGMRYFSGKGVKEDPKEAVKWLEKAAIAGERRCTDIHRQSVLQGNRRRQRQCQGRLLAPESRDRRRRRCTGHLERSARQRRSGRNGNGGEKER